MKRSAMLLVAAVTILASCGAQGQKVGKINAEGLTREGNSYVNDAYADSDVTLEVDVEGGVGEINLEVV